MEVNQLYGLIGFLYVSLGSSTVQIHDSLGSRIAHGHVQKLVSVVKMATVLKGVLPKSNVMFCISLWTKELNAKEIHEEMFHVYDGKCLLHKMVHNWVEKFSQRSTKVADDAR
jgi:hypothetical protein